MKHLSRKILLKKIFSTMLYAPTSRFFTKRIDSFQFSPRALHSPESIFYLNRSPVHLFRPTSEPVYWQHCRDAYSIHWSKCHAPSGGTSGSSAARLQMSLNSGDCRVGRGRVLGMREMLYVRRRWSWTRWERRRRRTRSKRLYYYIEISDAVQNGVVNNNYHNAVL